MQKRNKGNEEQQRYASFLHKISSAGFIFLIFGFVLYISDLLPSVVSPSKVTENWHLRVHDYVQITGEPNGWNWVNYLGYGDIVNFLGLVFLALITLFSFVAVLSIYIKKRDKAFIIIVLIQIFVFILAASGLINGG